MRRGGAFLILLLLSGFSAKSESPITPVSQTPVDANLINDYAFAQKCYHTVDKKDVLALENCIQQFLLICRSYPETDQGRKGLYSVARLSGEKFEVSKQSADLQMAFTLYNDFLHVHPKDLLADDALYQIGVLRFEKEKDKGRAERAFQILLERYP